MSSTREKPVLRLDWCSYAAAKYAVEHWHYSGRMPVGKLVHIGVWETGVFTGAVVFGRGASPHLGKRFGVRHEELAELVHVALRPHAAPTSRVVAIAVRMLRKLLPGLRCLVSFADANEGHHGGIYQACGWVYTGRSGRKFDYRTRDGRVLKDRLVTGTGLARQFGRLTRVARTSDCEAIPREGKHRYALPLDDAMRPQIERLRKPYPKRVPVSGTSEPTEAGGANPTRTLQADNAVQTVTRGGLT